MNGKALWAGKAHFLSKKEYRIYEPLNIVPIPIPTLYCDFIIPQLGQMDIDGQVQHLLFVAKKVNSGVTHEWKPVIEKLKQTAFLRSGTQRVSLLYDNEIEVSMREALKFEICFAARFRFFN